MVKYYIQIETPALVSGKIDKAATVTIDGTNYTGVVKGAMELADVGVVAGTRDIKFVVDATGKMVNAKVDV